MAPRFGFEDGDSAERWPGPKVPNSVANGPTGYERPTLTVKVVSGRPTPSEGPLEVSAVCGGRCVPRCASLSILAQRLSLAPAFGADLAIDVAQRHCPSDSGARSGRNGGVRRGCSPHGPIRRARRCGTGCRCCGGPARFDHYCTQVRGTRRFVIPWFDHGHQGQRCSEPFGDRARPARLHPVDVIVRAPPPRVDTRWWCPTPARR
jgi:hypothetical protein